MTTTTPTYAAAVAAIRTHAEARQGELDRAAAEARAACIAALRAAATEGVAEDDPARPVCELVAQTLTVGRESDGYPVVSIPDSTRAAIVAGVAAGIVPGDAHTIRTGGMAWEVYQGRPHDLRDGGPAWRADYTAWRAAAAYRTAQTWPSL